MPGLGVVSRERLRAAIVAVVALASATCVSGVFEDGQFRCDPAGGDGQCPDDMGCGSDGLCRHAPCAAGHADCDGDPANGCEAALGTSATDCGACGHACATETGDLATCDDGVCRAVCTTGFADCDGDVANGCEIELATSFTNCGACGHACRAGACERGRCSAVPP